MERRKPSFDKLMSKIRKNPYEIPPSVISQLKEHTAGFLLCALDNHGNLKYYTHFDNQSVSDTIEFKLLQILAAKNQISSQSLFDQLNGGEETEE